MREGVLGLGGECAKQVNRRRNKKVCKITKKFYAKRLTYCKTGCIMRAEKG